MGLVVADLEARLTLDDQMSAGLQKAGSAIDSMGGDIAKGTRASMDMAQREVGQQIGSYGKALSKGWSEVEAIASSYDQALADIFAVAPDLSSYEKDILNSTIKDLSAGTRFNARETAGAAEELLKAGMSYQDIVGGALEGSLDLAAAGGIGVPRAAEVMASGLNLMGDSLQYVSDTNADGFISTLEKATHLNDVFAQSAATSMTDVSGLADSFENAGGTLSAMGQDFETGVTALTAMSAFGNVGAEAGTGLKSMLNGVISNADAIEGLGVAVTDTEGNYRDILDIFTDLDKATEWMSERDRSQFLLDTFGSYGQKAASQLLDYDDKTGQSLLDVEQGLLNQGAAADMAAARMDSYLGAQEAVAGAQERLALAFGEPALEAQKDLLLDGADALNMVADAAYELPKPLRAGLGMLTKVSGAALEMAGSAIYAAPGIRALGESFTQLKSAPGIIGGLARGAGMLLRLAGPAGLAAAAGLAAYQTNFLGFADAVDGMARRIQQALPATQAALGDFVDEIATRGGDFMNAVGQGDWQAASDIAGQAVGDASSWVQEQLNRGGSWLEGLDIGSKLTLDAEQLSGLSTVGTNLGSTIGGALVSGLQGAGGLKDWLVQNMPTSLSGIGDAFQSALGGVFEEQMPAGLGGTVGQGGPAGTVLNGFANLLGGVKDGIASEFENAFASGALPTPSSDFIVQPITSMLESAQSALDTAFNNFRAWLAGKILDMLNILDQIPGTDFASDRYIYQQIADQLDDTAPIRSFPDDRIDYGQIAAERAAETTAIEAIAEDVVKRDALLEQANAVAASTTAMQTPLPEDVAAGEALKGFDLRDWLFGDMDPGDWVGEQIQGAGAAGLPAQGADAARGELAAAGLNAATSAVQDMQEIAAAYAEATTAAQEAAAARAEYEAYAAQVLEDAALAADSTRQASKVSPVGWGGESHGTGSMGPAGMAAHEGEVYVNTLPKVGTGGDKAAMSGAGAQILQQAQQTAQEILSAAQQGAQILQQAMAQAQQMLSQATSTAGMTPGAAGATAVPSPGLGAGGMAPTGMPTGGAASGLAAQLQADMSAAASAVTSGMSAINSAITSGVSQIQAAMTQMATGIQSGISQAAAAFQSGAAQMAAAVQTIISALNAAAAQAQAAAASIGQGIVAGLQSQLGAVQAAAAELASAAAAGIQGVVQMGSPSRMAIPYGQSIGEGLAYGMEQQSPEVIAAAKKLGYDVENGLAPLMDSVSMTGQAAANALGLDMEQLLAEKVNGMEGWDPKSQVDMAALSAFDDAAAKMAKYGKRSGDVAAQKAGEAFAGLADNMSNVLAGTETYLSDELARQALRSYRRLDADAKAKLPDDMKNMLKETYDEANITIGDVIEQRMGQAGFEKGAAKGLGSMFAERKEMFLRGMLGQRTLEQKAQAAAEDGLSLAIDAVKNGLMSAAPSAEGAAESAMKQALGSIGSQMGGGAAGPMGGASPEEFAWALCECISGANQDMLGSLGLGNPAETGVAMLGHDLANEIAGTGNDFRDAMLSYADQNPALALPKEWLGDTADSCMNICDRAANELGTAAGDAAGAAMGGSMPSMPSGADFGGAAGAAMSDGLKQQCISLCGGSVDDMASGVAGGVNDGLGDMAIKDAALNMSTSGARELGKQLRGGIPGAEVPTMPGASPDDLAGGVADGITSQCISLCDDSGMGEAAGDMSSAAGDMGSQIEQLTNSMVGQKFNETLSGIADGLGGGGGSGQPGIPDDVEVPPLIHKLNPNIGRALSFDLATTNPHAAALMSGLGGVPGAMQPAVPSGANLSGGPLAGGGAPIQIENHLTVELDGQAVGRSVMNTMVPRLGQAAQNMRRGSSMSSRA